MSASAAECWWRPFRTVDTATVMHVDLTENAAHEAAALTWLDEQERDRSSRYLFDSPRRRFVLCRAALRAILSERLGCSNERLAFDVAEHGKPVALVEGVPTPISFNVSHSGVHGLIAIAPEGRLGVDVEERVSHRNMDLLIEGVFGQTEQAELASTRGHDKTHLFFKLWTIKEALIKAHGAGFAVDVSQFEVHPDMLNGTAKAVMRLPQLPEVVWQVEDLGNERFAAAIAHEAGGEANTEMPAA